MPDTNEKICPECKRLRAEKEQLKATLKVYEFDKEMLKWLNQQEQEFRLLEYQGLFVCLCSWSCCFPIRVLCRCWGRWGRGVTDCIMLG